MPVPYLCGGTFFTLLFKAKKGGNIDSKYVIRDGECLRKQNSEAIIFNAFLSIYRLDEKYTLTNLGSLKTITSKYKNCQTVSLRLINKTFQDIEKKLMTFNMSSTKMSKVHQVSL